MNGSSTAEAAECGIVRPVVAGPSRARAVLQDAGFTTHVSQLICARVPDEPGGLARVPEELASAGISVDSLYSIASHSIGFGVRDIGRAIALLRDKVEMLDDEEVRAP